MARVNLNDAEKYMGGGGSFFKLEDGESKKVRFLFNSPEEVEESALVVHEYTGKQFATIDCSRNPGDPLDACKWCASKNNPVMRVVLPLYVEDAKEIQYWKKSGKWVKDTVMELFKNLPEGAPISGQIFTISRRGKKMQDTVYTVAPDMKIPNDNKKKDEFGEVKDPFDLNIIKPNDYDFDPVANAEDSNQPTTQSTRRTTDIF